MHSSRVLILLKAAREAPSARNERARSTGSMRDKRGFNVNVAFKTRINNIEVGCIPFAKERRGFKSNRHNITNKVKK